MDATVLVVLAVPDLIAGLRPDSCPYALTPNTGEPIPTLGALFPRGGPVQDPVFTPGSWWCWGAVAQGYLAHKKHPPP